MKRVIRQSVFETNSSSTHSIVYKRKTDVDYIERLNKKLFAHRCTGGSKIENNLDKLILVLALLNHAKIEGQEYASYAESCLNKYFTNKTKFRNSLMETFIDLIDKDNVLSVACNDYYFKKGDKYVFDHFGVVLEEFSKEEFLIHLQKYSNLILYISISDAFYKEDCNVDLSTFIDFHENVSINNFKIMAFYSSSVIVEKFKEELFKEYCRVENKTISQLNAELKDKKYDDNFTCESLFCEGPLDECSCGFEDFDSILTSFGLDIYCGGENIKLEEKCRKAAEELFSGNYHFVLHEH